MEDDNSIVAVKDTIEKHLRASFNNFDKLDITFSKVEQGNSDETWRINVEYSLIDDEDDNVKHVALYSVNSGRVIRFEEGKCWTS